MITVDQVLSTVLTPPYLEMQQIKLTRPETTLLETEGDVPRKEGQSLPSPN